MYLKNLSLIRFRNFEKINLTFHPHYNFIVGRNGQGKTNIIEAIYYLSFLKSFRTSEKKELISVGSESLMTQISASLVRQDLSHDIILSLENNKRSLRLNGKNCRPYEDYYGLAPVLLFEPRDVYLFRDSPSIRRKYINRALFLDNASVLKNQIQYEKIVQQKNRLLKEELVSFADLEVWNQKLAEVGSLFVLQRLSWILRLSEFLKKEWKDLNEDKKIMGLVYECSFLPEIKMETLLVMNQQDLEKALLSALEKIWPQEKRRRESLVGPHRDDWGITLNDQEVGVYGSQGENRLVLLALKGAQLKLFEKEQGFSPLFLLDDVMSELDLKHAQNLVSSLKERGGQVFLTTTDLAQMPFSQAGEKSTFIVESGCISMLEK